MNRREFVEAWFQRVIEAYGVAKRAEGKLAAAMIDDGRATELAAERRKDLDAMMVEILDGGARLAGENDALRHELKQLRAECARLRGTLYAVRTAAKHGALSDVAQAIDEHEDAS